MLSTTATETIFIETALIAIAMRVLTVFNLNVTHIFSV